MLSQTDRGCAALAEGDADAEPDPFGDAIIGTGLKTLVGSGRACATAADPDASAVGALTAPPVACFFAYSIRSRDWPFE